MLPRIVPVPAVRAPLSPFDIPSPLREVPDVPPSSILEQPAIAQPNIAARDRDKTRFITTAFHQNLVRKMI